MKVTGEDQETGKTLLLSLTFVKEGEGGDNGELEGPILSWYITSVWGIEL